MAQQSNPPMKEFRAAGSGVKAAIWRNEVDKDGSTVIRHSIKLTKSYRDAKTGEWKSMEINLFPSEIPAARLVLTKAFEFVSLRTGEGDAERAGTSDP